LPISLGYEKYPSNEEVIDILKRQTDRIYFVNGTERAKELGNVRTLNMFMLGCASVFLPIKVHVWKDGIFQRLPSNIRRINLVAFAQGRKEIRDVYL